MKPRRTISSYILLVGVMGLSIVGGVVAYQVYAAVVKSQTTAEQTVAIKPLDGVINQATIDSLKRRRVYTDAQMNSLLISAPVMEASGAAVAAVESSMAATTQ